MYIEWKSLSLSDKECTYCVTLAQLLKEGKVPIIATLKCYLSSILDIVNAVYTGALVPVGGGLHNLQL
jgi:hypothetical protein